MTNYGACRQLVTPVGAGENIQFWAKDTSGNWYDINVDGWGDTNGFELPAEYNVTTDIYVLSDKVGTYELDVKLVDVDAENAVIAEVSGTVTVISEEDVLDAVNAAEDKDNMKSILEQYASALGLEMEAYEDLPNHEASWPSSEERQLSVANYVIDKRAVVNDGDGYTEVGQVATAFAEGVAYEKGKLDFHAAVYKANIGDSLAEAIEAVKGVYTTMATNLGIELDNGELEGDDGTLQELVGMLTAYSALDERPQGHIDEYVLAHVTGTDRLSREIVFGTMAHAFDEDQEPALDSATVKKDGNDLILTVTVGPDGLQGLYKLEIDHSHGKYGRYAAEGSDGEWYLKDQEGDASNTPALPEFHVYAWEEYPCGSEELTTAFAGYGIFVDYKKDTLTWTITFKPGEDEEEGNPTFLDVVDEEQISNGAIEFYLVAHNINGKSSGHMGGEQGAMTALTVTYEPQP